MKILKNFILILSILILGGCVNDTSLNINNIKDLYDIKQPSKIIYKELYTIVVTLPGDATVSYETFTKPVYTDNGESLSYHVGRWMSSPVDKCKVIITMVPWE